MEEEEEEETAIDVSISSIFVSSLFEHLQVYDDGITFS